MPICQKKIKMHVKINEPGTYAEGFQHLEENRRNFSQGKWKKIGKQGRENVEEWVFLKTYDEGALRTVGQL
jgi:hypothetical protein